MTGKIRLGWDDESRNYLETARIIEANGGKLIAVHARTKKQAYGGEADWDAIAEVKQAVSVPVIGNGDVKTVDDIRAIKARTGCDAVMVGRGAIENPWIFTGQDREAVAPAQAYPVMRRHLERMLEFYGERGLILFRKFASRYILPYGPAQEVREALLTCAEAGRFLELLEEIVFSGDLEPVGVSF